MPDQAVVCVALRVAVALSSRTSIYVCQAIRICSILIQGLSIKLMRPPPLHWLPFFYKFDVMNKTYSLPTKLRQFLRALRTPTALLCLRPLMLRRASYGFSLASSAFSCMPWITNGKYLLNFSVFAEMLIYRRSMVADDQLSGIHEAESRV